jgi:hypothetical protein
MRSYGHSLDVDGSFHNQACSTVEAGLPVAEVWQCDNAMDVAAFGRPFVLGPQGTQRAAPRVDGWNLSQGLEG